MLFFEKYKKSSKLLQNDAKGTGGSWGRDTADEDEEHRHFIDLMERLAISLLSLAVICRESASLGLAGASHAVTACEWDRGQRRPLETRGIVKAFGALRRKPWSESPRLGF